MPQYKLPPPPTELPEQRWFQLLYARILAANIGAVSWGGLDFSLSNLTSVVTRNHNDLQLIQGGAVADYQHLTTAQVGSIAVSAGYLAAGLTATITTAKLTTGGANGSMTFTHGVLTAQTAAT